MKQYDYIFAGGGMAGLSLAYYFTQYESLRDKQILIIDRDRKDKNDRTWCFWEKGTGAFDKIVFRKWNGVYFHSKTFSQFLDLQDYHYKMIRGIHFYEFVLSHLKKFSSIEFLQADIQQIEGGVVTVKDLTSTQQFKATSWLFDSIHQFKLNLPQHHNLLQHFKGWVIRTPTSKFDPKKPVMMDFRIEQHDECRFVYVMPFSETEALVEFTLFTEKLLDKELYDIELKKYLIDFLQISDYQVLEEEFGIIPMTDEPTQRFPSPQVMRIGTAGGSTKPSSGYTFTRTQHQLQNIAKNLAQNLSLETSKTLFQKRFIWLDKVFLNVLQHKRVPADEIFTRLYQRNNTIKLLRFLDEETTILEDINIMKSLPIWQFIKAALSH